MREAGSVSVRVAPFGKFCFRTLVWAVIVLAACLFVASVGVSTSRAESGGGLFDSAANDAMRHEAIRAMPLEKLVATDRAKIETVIANVSIYRRMPVRVVRCEPELYLFLVRHPDVVVNIWELMKVTKLQVRDIGQQHFRIQEAAGTIADAKVLYSSRDTQLLYAEGVYRGPLFARAVNGRGVLLLKSSYMRDAEGRCLVTSCLDSFIAIEPLGAELIGKTIQPIVGRTADNNFVQTIGFVGSLARTVQVDSRSVQRLAMRLDRVAPEVRNEFAKLAADLGGDVASAERDGAELAERSPLPTHR